MAATKTEMRDDIILRLTQAKPSADFEVPNSQIDRWIDIARDKIVSEYIVQTFKFGGVHDIDPAYIELANTTFAASLNDHKATITANILSIPPNDAGLIQIRIFETANDNAETVINQTDIFTAKLAKEMEFSAPTLTRPIAYRAGADLYILGINNPSTITPEDYTLQVEYIQGMTGGSSDYVVSDSHVADITEFAWSIGAKELGIIIVDPVNDGDQNPPAQPQTRTRR